jgi:hypothetical protein
MRILFWWGFFFIAFFAFVAFLAPAAEANVAAFGGLLALSFALALLMDCISTPRWRLRRGGRESGPLSAREIALLQQSGQLGKDAQVRGRWGGDWTPFLVTAKAPNRLDPAVLFGLVALAAGFGVSYGLFGRVEGHWMPLEWLVEMPQQDRLDRTILDWLRAIPNPASGMADVAQSRVEGVLKHIQMSRILILGSAAGLGLIAAIAAAAMAPPRYRIVRERA